jgi:pimeloyl-ACP methyl ester carboxylesterase
LGVERINLVGGSYGTRAALEYQRLFPQRVRRAVLDGVAPPDMVLPAAYAIDGQAALDALFAACAGEPACAAREPDLRTRWRRWLDTLPQRVTLAHPLTGATETVTLTHDAVLSMVRGPLYVPALAAGLPAAIDAATRSRLEPLAALALALAMTRRRGTEIAAGMHFAVVCAEDFPRLAANGAGRHGGASKASDFGSGFADNYEAVCRTITRGNVPADFYSVPAASAATLLLSGGIDPATPPRHGDRVAAALGKKARHVVVPNAGHGVMGIGCMRDVLFRFVDAQTDEEALAVDAGCATAIPRPPMFEPPGPGAMAPRDAAR